MSMVETILVFAVIPLAIYGAVSLVTLRAKFAGRSRYRPGQEWEYPPLWWSANPEGIGEAGKDSGSEHGARGVSMSRGGASGSW